MLLPVIVSVVPPAVGPANGETDNSVGAVNENEYAGLEIASTLRVTTTVQPVP